MDRIDKYEETTAKNGSFIKSPLNNIYNELENPTFQELIECMRATTVINSRAIAAKTLEVEKLSQTIDQTQAIEATSTISALAPKKQPSKRKKSKDLTDIIDFITFSPLDDDTQKKLQHLTEEDILEIKHYFYKQYLETTKKIKESILLEPTHDISKLQHDLNLYELILEFIKDLSNEKEEEQTLEEENDYSNIIFAPNGKKSTYIFEDISDYQERSKEIKLIIDKIVDGYFLKTKDTKSIEGTQENLFEYRHPNGLRILYVVNGNIIIICSLFFKDKQKSSRITNEYEEALSRYYSARDYIEINFTNPDFHIEQAELKGEIYAFLENGISLSKKVGE